MALQAADQTFTILLVTGRAWAGLEENTNIGHILRYWTAQPAVPFVSEAGGASVFYFSVCLYVGLFTCLSGFQFKF